MDQNPSAIVGIETDGYDSHPWLKGIQSTAGSISLRLRSYGKLWPFDQTKPSSRPEV